MNKYLLAVLMILLAATPSLAKVKVVTTLPWIGSIAKEIGRDNIEITTLIKPMQDPHFAEARPSMILAARKADILMYNGLELEIGYLPRIIESSNNPGIQPGRTGNLDCSQFITPMEKPSSFDRSMGDVHPLGNPHYHFSPKNILRVAEGMANALSGIDSGNADFYRSNLQLFKDRLAEKQRQWSSMPLKGKKYISYHKLFEYLAQENGFQILGYIEPKPGIPPSAGHIEEMIALIKKAKPNAIIATYVAGKKEAASLSLKTGARSVVLPHDVGATETAKDWFSLMDEVLKGLE
ncbi:MAG: zinc ABC transporter substrate-binding protein [Nitrospiraceae bacterium]|nr:MAG: zinc ABC transporter substrate-binding protein [Nitrospiraceae bacterium]